MVVAVLLLSLGTLAAISYINGLATDANTKAIGCRYAILCVFKITLNSAVVPLYLGLRGIEVKPISLLFYCSYFFSLYTCKICQLVVYALLPFLLGNNNSKYVQPAGSPFVALFLNTSVNMYKCFFN